MNKDTWILIGAVIALSVAGAGGAVAVNAVFGNLNATQIATLAQNAGFSGQDLLTAVSVALAESSGNPNALGDVGIGQGSFGLWQINSLYHPEYGPDFTVLYDPQTNANAAYAIYSQAGNRFTPWSTFKNGMYAKYLPGVQSSIGVA